MWPLDWSSDVCSSDLFQSIALDSSTTSATSLMESSATDWNCLASSDTVSHWYAFARSSSVDISMYGMLCWLIDSSPPSAGRTTELGKVGVSEVFSAPACTYTRTSLPA